MLLLESKSSGTSLDSVPFEFLAVDHSVFPFSVYLPSMSKDIPLSGVISWDIAMKLLCFPTVSRFRRLRNGFYYFGHVNKLWLTLTLNFTKSVILRTSHPRIIVWPISIWASVQGVFSRLVVCPMQCMKLYRYNVSWVHVCLSVCLSEVRIVLDSDRSFCPIFLKFEMCCI